uniref:Uncharacterized protein n=1 Tax=Oryza brachyantha TaxID=4533 RepID=J3KXJ5_ORYBR
MSVAEEIEGSAEPSSYSKVIVSADSNRWIAAMHDEMESLEKNQTWKLVELPKEKKHIRCKWIFKRKEGISRTDEVRYKAKLVAKRYSQILGIDFNDEFSPVVKHSSIRTLLGIVAMHDYELEQLDVKTVFLHGELEEDTYMEQPEGFIVPGKENLVCRLDKSLYGLKQSPRQCLGRLEMDLFVVDSDFTGDLDKRRSLTDYVFTIGGCAVSWKASLQATVALSTTEAEYMAISEAGKEATWLRGLYTELWNVPDTAIIIRRHGLASDLFSCLLFNELEAFNPRDQLAFAYVRDQMNPKVSMNMFDVEVFDHIAVEYRHNLKRGDGGAGGKQGVTTMASSGDITRSSCERYLLKMWGEPTE